MKNGICLLALIFSVQVATAQTTEADWLKKADTFYASKDYENALAAYQLAFQLNAKNETTIYRILFSMNELSQYDRAITFLNTIPAATIANNDDISGELSYAARRGSNYSQSIQLLKGAQNLNPTQILYTRALANVYCYDQQYVNAMTTFSILNTKDKLEKIDYENWCYTLNELGKYTECIDIGKKGIQLYPDHAPIYNEVGYAFKKLKKYKEAKSYLIQSRDLDSTSSSTWENLGEVYKASGSNDDLYDAARCFRKVISMDKATYLTYYHLGWCYNETEDYNLAINALSKSAELKADHDETFVELGYADYKTGNYDKAIEAFKKALALNPTSELGHYYAGLTYYMLKDQASVQTEYNNLKGLHSDYAEQLRKYLK